MGYIKQLKNKDLVGGITNDDIYPITATSAVYDLDGKSLDQILKDITSGLYGGGAGSGTTTTQDKIENIIIFGPGLLNPTSAWVEEIRSTNGIPSGWTLTSNVSLKGDQYVYMATGKKVNNNFVTVEDNYYWSYPLRITNAPGDSSTSSTGADGSNINMVYYRTNTKVTNPAAITPTFGVSSIESITNKDWGLSPTGTLISNATTEAWRDHPLGIDKDHKYEYISVNVTKPNASGTALEWLGYSSPALWSNWGEAGTDGDGVEYIFCLWPHYLLDTATSQIISKRTAGPNSSTSDPEADDFIPTNPKAVDTLAGYNWSDNPLPVTEADPYLYVSIRKRTWNEHDKASHWGEFSDPVLWSRYGRDGVATEYVLSSNNDQVVIDDNIHSNTSEALNADFVLMKNGEAVSAGVYYKINTDSTIIPLAGGNCWTPTINKSTGKLSYTIASSVTKVTEDIYKTAVDAYIQDSVNGTETFDGAKYRKVASRLLIIQVKDFSAGEVYKLIVSPQVLKVNQNNVITSSPYWDIKVQKIDGEGVTSVEVDDVNLKLEFLTPSGTKLSGMPMIGQTVESDYIVVNLSLKQGSSWIRVDSETIGIVKDGKDGLGIYNVEIDNTTIILDDTLVASSVSAYNSTLELVSKTHCVLYKGDQEMSDWKIVKSSSSDLPPLFDIEINGEYVKLVYTGTEIPSSLSTASKLAIGHYKIVLDFVLSSNVSNIYTTKIINFTIEDITPDGTVYRLNISNNLRVFTDKGEAVTSSQSKITVQSITNGSPKLESFHTSLRVPTSSSAYLTVVGSNLPISTLDSGVTSHNISEMTYNANGYLYLLYKGNVLVDLEQIVCIKNGADGDGIPGASGKSEYLICDVASIYYDTATSTCTPGSIIVSYMITRDKGVDGNSGLFETVCDATKVISFGISSGSGGTNLGTAYSGNPFILDLQEPRLGDYVEAICGDLNLKIPIVFSAKQGIEGCVIRQSKFINDDNIWYRNDSSLPSPREGEAARYIDVVWIGEVWDSSLAIYMTLSDWSPREYNLNNPDQLLAAITEKKIKRIEAADPSYIPLLITDNLVFRTGQGNNLYLMNSQGDIIGGMMSTDSDTGDPVRIFAGTNISTSTPGLGEVSTAKFRVTLSGKLFASDAIILGTGQFTGNIIANSGIFKGQVKATSFETTTGDLMSVKATENQFQFIGRDTDGDLRPLAYFKYGSDSSLPSTVGNPTVLLYIWDSAAKIYKVINLENMIASGSGSSICISVLPYVSGVTNIDNIFSLSSGWIKIYKTVDGSTTSYRIGSTTGLVPSSSNKYLEVSLIQALIPIYNEAGGSAVYPYIYYLWDTIYQVLMVEYTGSTRTVKGTCYVTKDVYWNNGPFWDNQTNSWRIFSLTSAPSSNSGKRVYLDTEGSYLTLNSSAKVLPNTSTIGVKSNETGTLKFSDTLFKTQTYSAGQGPLW